MENNKYKKKIKRFQWRLNIEAGIRAGTVGLAAGFAGMAAILLYGRLCYQKLMITEAGGIAVVLWLVVALLTYFLGFRPKKKEVLARIDAMGLQERVITMEELKEEETVIAKKQRQDTKERLEELDTSGLNIKLYIWPFLCCLGLVAVVAMLILLPLPEKKVDELAEQNALEMELVDEMITALKEIVENSEVKEEHKSELTVIVEALAVSFTPEDSTLTRTAKIATASKRLDMLESAEKSEVALKKQQSDGAEEEEVEAMEKEQKLLSATVKKMKDTMGTSITVLNKTQGTFWTPGGPSAGTSYDVTPLPFEEPTVEGEEPPEGMEPGEGEEPPEGMEPGEGGESQEGQEGEGAGGQTIFDPEQGEIGYGSVYEEYYQEILKALTEREFSEDIRKIIEDYANSLE